MRAELTLVDDGVTVEVEGSCLIRRHDRDPLDLAVANMVKGLSHRHLLMLAEAVDNELADRGRQ